MSDKTPRQILSEFRNDGSHEQFLLNVLTNYYNRTSPSLPPSQRTEEQFRNDEYWSHQDELREAGFTPYNCDELDEFPNMNRRR